MQNPNSMSMAPLPGADWLALLPRKWQDFCRQKGWRSPLEALEAYRKLETTSSSPSPAHMPPGESRPESPEAYALEEILAGQEVHPEFARAMRLAMHEAGLSNRQAQNLTRAWQEQISIFKKAAQIRCQREREDAVRDFSPHRLEAARRGFRHSGLGADIAEILEETLGPACAVELFARLGAALAEDQLATDLRPLGTSASPDTAERRLDQLLKDSTFSQRYLAGDERAVTEISELAKRIVASR